MPALLPTRQATEGMTAFTGWVPGAPPTPRRGERRAAVCRTRRRAGAEKTAASVSRDSTGWSNLVEGPVATDVLERVRWNDAGLVAVIAQQHDTLEVLMMAWMNDEALRETMATGRVCYYSRSRKSLWRKGESSGQFQYLHRMELDCDADAILVLVDQIGVACHTGRRSCFSWGVGPDGVKPSSEPLVDPAELYGK